MSASEILALISEMENGEKIELLRELYYRHFDKGISQEQLTEEARILEMYYGGELVEAQD